ncbi:MAG: hypothetical protein ACLTDM_13140 [Clostridium butyricum]
MIINKAMIMNMVAIVISSLSLFVSYLTYLDNRKPKVKLNINQIDEYLNNWRYYLLIENISSYNLYDFEIQITNFDEYIKKNGFKPHLIKSKLKTFTINQSIKTYLDLDYNRIDNTDEDINLNIKIKYKLHQRRFSRVHKENFTVNVQALHNIYLHKDC